MTQMLLFDAPAGIADSTLVPVADAAKSPLDSNAENVAATLQPTAACITWAIWRDWCCCDTT